MRQSRVGFLFTALVFAITVSGQQKGNSGAAPAGAVNAHSSQFMSKRAPGKVFRDCRVCPEMVVLPPGSFNMGSSPEEKSWAASHGSSMASVADEAPQHQVSDRIAASVRRWSFSRLAASTWAHHPRKNLGRRVTAAVWHRLLMKLRNIRSQIGLPRLSGDGRSPAWQLQHGLITRGKILGGESRQQYGIGC